MGPYDHICTNFITFLWMLNFLSLSTHSASIITQTTDEKPEVVRYYISQPVLEFDSSFDMEKQMRDPRILFDGDIYYSGAKPFWEYEENHNSNRKKELTPL